MNVMLAPIIVPATLIASIHVALMSACVSVDLEEMATIAQVCLNQHLSGI